MARRITTHEIIRNGIMTANIEMENSRGEMYRQTIYMYNNSIYRLEYINDKLISRKVFHK